ncbi:methyltransferase-like protein 25 [Xenopus laevis]|uniref:Methyltransferase-like protein 25 n=2 Tax=Xenopus laevis TaxID=8355 RepID=A0A8J1ML77_XENLA|nr:methyltransferase-like protein 25 [Xenopus laevis]XP_041442227.1 methyltransferase-like protein 25 [Xenopus laevis]XP_041442228.1 methyltransferase-like protein 25 [Xenopus laevis]
MFPSLCEVSTDQLKEAVKKLLHFLHGTLQISGAHTVDFYTQNIWKTLVAVSPDIVLSVISKHNGAHHKGKDIPDISRIFSGPNQELVNIEAFVEASHSHSLANLGLCISVEELLEALAVHEAGSPDNEVKTDQFMNDKKSHEVLVMSQLVQSIANVCGVKEVIDLGAGKGYLSSYLSMKYNLKVYGIDSSDTNTDGANRRNRKLKKFWKAYKEDAKGASKIQESAQNNDYLLPNYSCQEVITDREFPNPKSCFPKLEELSVSHGVESINVLSEWKSGQESLCSTSQSAESDKTSAFLNILPADAVEEKTLSESICKSLSEQEKEQRKIENIRMKEQRCSHVYLPLTCKITEETDLNDIIEDLEESIMVGLHTCGDLAPNTLRIFTARSEIKAVCSVGCCYHLLSEEFESPTEERTVTTWGFPMSMHLKETSWFFGRNARMSACLALERVAVGQGLATESLFYRAVLQVILKDCFGITQSGKRVGKIFSKSGNFTDYVRKSLKKLGHDDSKISDKNITAYYEKYKPRQNELEAFNMLKVLLAPCIEALILLDRLHYLKEQNNLAWSGLVKLFDPVKSPRCYSVVSMKKPKDTIY